MWLGLEQAQQAASLPAHEQRPPRGSRRDSDRHLAAAAFGPPPQMPLLLLALPPALRS